MMTGQTNSLLQTARKSPLLRVLLIGFLILLLQIPIAMIDGLIAERRETRDDVMQEVTDKWGREQTIVGPALMVPYVHRWTETDERGQTRARKSMRHAIFLPEALSIDGNARSESRHRGIFEVPVYRAAIEITGRFGKPEFSDWGIPSGDVRWDRAQLIMRISDARAIQEQVHSRTPEGDDAGRVLRVFADAQAERQHQAALGSFRPGHDHTSRIELAQPELSGKLAADHARRQRGGF
jgi:inner membrane protein